MENGRPTGGRSFRSSFAKKGMPTEWIFLEVKRGTRGDIGEKHKLKENKVLLVEEDRLEWMVHWVSVTETGNQGSVHQGKLPPLVSKPGRLI